MVSLLPFAHTFIAFGLCVFRDLSQGGLDTTGTWGMLFSLHHHLQNPPVEGTQLQRYHSQTSQKLDLDSGGLGWELQDL